MSIKKIIEGKKEWRFKKSFKEEPEKREGEITHQINNFNIDQIEILEKC
jgi:hypothetical protein